MQNVVDATDVNSIAGVLKLYLRELREPLFPIFLFDQLTECAKYSKAEEFVKQVETLISAINILLFRAEQYICDTFFSYTEDCNMDGRVYL